MPNAIDLVTLNDWQDQRGIPQGPSAQDSILITQCSARILEFLGRTLAQASYTEMLSGNGTQFLWLRNRPLTNSGLTVWEDDTGGQTFDSTSVLTYGTDYDLVVDQPDGVTCRCGLLRRIGALWFAPPTYQGLVISPVQNLNLGRNIKVAYTAGFAAIPFDIQQACMLLAASVKAMAQLGNAILSEGDETYNYTLRALVGKAFGALPADTLAVLAKYRNQPIA